MDNLNPPVVSTQPNVVGLSEFLRFTEMFTVTDPDPDSQILRMQFRDNRIGGGNFVVGGVVQEANVWHEVSIEQAGSVRYQGAPFFNRESFSVRVFDGEFWSNTAYGGLTSGNARPELAGIDGRVGANDSLPVAPLLQYTDGDNDALQRLFIVDRKIGTNGGQFRLGDQLMPQGEWFQVEAAELSSLFYEGATQGRDVERISAMAFDGFSWSEVADFNIATTAETVIQPNPQQVLIGDRRPAREFFSTIDADGDNVTHVIAVDYRFNANGGYWEYQGERMPSAEWFVVPIQFIDQLYYVGGAVGPQTENVGFQVYDGFEFSRITNVQVDTVVPPMVDGRDAEVQSNHYLNIATGGVANVSGTKPVGQPILDYVDADGDLIEEFMFVERQFNSNGGHFIFRGDRLPPATWFRVSADELDELEYRGGEFGPQTETISVRVFANGVWSEMDSFQIGTLQNLFAPELNLVNAQGRLGTTFTLESLFTWSDADGDLPAFFRLFDTGDAAGSNYFSVNGVRQPARTWIQLDWDQVSEVRYHLSDQANEEQFRMLLSDGRNLSTLQTATMEAVGAPVIEASTNDISVDTIERVPASSIINQTDLGPSLIQYQVYDENDFFRSGRIELDGVDLQQGVVHTLTADEFDRLVFKGAEVDFGRQLDPVLIRGDNGITGWTEWTRVNVNTDPVGGSSLVSGTQITNHDGGEVTEITYTFIDGGNQSGGTRQNPNYPPLPTYYPPEATCDNPIGLEALNTRALSQPQRESIREVFANYETYANVEFREVAYTGDAADAELVFGAWGNFDCGLAGAAAYAFLPGFDGRGNVFSDIWYNTNPALTDYDPDTPTDVSLGGSFRLTSIHEIGHALGFKHPFEGSPFLSIFTNFDYLTTMAYQHDSQHNRYDPYPEQPSTLMLYDVMELQRLYGVNTNYNPGNNHYGNGFSGSYPHFISNSEQHQTTIFDGGGIDTLNYTSHVANETIDLREGTWSSVNGVQQSLRIAYDAEFENARGGSGNDNIRGNEIRNLLFGNGGDDTLRGGGGNDVMRGGTGNDTFIWSLGDGRDSVREEGNGGLEEIKFFDPSGQINALEDDFVFRRFGDNLRIDITLNRGEGQGTVVVADFANQASAVELMTFHDEFGAQIGNSVDLNSVFAAADTTRQRFRLTSVEGDNGGFIAVPTV
ncbi:MAG: M10 family metallopeptidase [Planctomycetota bacterium]